MNKAIVGCIGLAILLSATSYFAKINISELTIVKQVTTSLLGRQNRQRIGNDILKTVQRSFRRLQFPSSMGNASQIIVEAFGEIDIAQLDNFKSSAEEWANSDRNLRIAVIGGSMTKGHGIQPGLAYSFVLERILHKIGISVEVHNAALGATGSMYYVESLSIHFNLSTYDFLVAEFSINDWADGGHLTELFKAARRLNPSIHIIYIRLHHPLYIFGVSVENRSVDLWNGPGNFTPYWLNDVALLELNWTRRFHGAYLWMEKYWQRLYNLEYLSFAERRRLGEPMATPHAGDGHPGVKGHETIAWCLAAYLQHGFDAIFQDRVSSNNDSSVEELDITTKGIVGVDAFATAVWSFRKTDKLKAAIRNASKAGLEILTKSYKQFESKFVSSMHSLEPGLTYITLGTLGAHVSFQFTDFSNEPKHCPSSWFPRLVITYRACNSGNCPNDGLLDIDISYRLKGVPDAVTRTFRPFKLVGYSWNGNIYEYVEGENMARDSFCPSKHDNNERQIEEIQVSIKQQSSAHFDPNVELFISDHPFLLHGIYVNYFCCF